MNPPSRIHVLTCGAASDTEVAPLILPRISRGTAAACIITDRFATPWIIHVKPTGIRKYVYALLAVCAQQSGVEEISLGGTPRLTE